MSDDTVALLLAVPVYFLSTWSGLGVCLLWFSLPKVIPHRAKILAAIAAGSLFTLQFWLFSLLLIECGIAGERGLGSVMIVCLGLDIFCILIAARRYLRLSEIGRWRRRALHYLPCPFDRAFNGHFLDPGDGTMGVLRSRTAPPVAELSDSRWADLCQRETARVAYLFARRLPSSDKTFFKFMLDWQRVVRLVYVRYGLLTPDAFNDCYWRSMHQFILQQEKNRELVALLSSQGVAERALLDTLPDSGPTPSPDARCLS